MNEEEFVGPFKLSNRFRLLDSEENLNHNTKAITTQAPTSSNATFDGHERKVSKNKKHNKRDYVPTNPVTNEPLQKSPKVSWHEHSEFVFWVDKKAALPAFSGKDIRVKLYKTPYKDRL